MDVRRLLEIILQPCIWFIQGSLDERAYTRVARHKLVHDKITTWRQEHDDWESLAAFALSKNTGRRFKKKKSRSHGSDMGSPTGENIGVSELKDTTEHVSCQIEEESDDSDGEEASSQIAFCDSSARKSSPGTASKPPVSAIASNVERVKLKPASKKKAEASHEVVVKKITLDQLSDEELFLPPADEVGYQLSENAAPTAASDVNAEGDFFVTSDDAESDDIIDQSVNDWQELNNDEQQPLSSDEEVTKPVKFFRDDKKFDKHKKFGIDKRTSNSKPFGGAHREDRSFHDRRKQFSSKEFTKSRGHFPNTKGNSYPSSTRKNSFKLQDKFQSRRQENDRSWKQQSKRLNFLLFSSQLMTYLYALSILYFLIKNLTLACVPTIDPS